MSWALVPSETLRAIWEGIKKTYRFARRLREPLSPLLHWNYTGGIGVTILLAGVVAVMTSQAFSFARWSIVIGGAWMILWWLSSEHILKERPADSCSVRKLWNAHRCREWIPVLLGACLFIYLFIFTNNSEREYQRSNVYSHVQISYSSPDEYGDDPLKSVITVQNNSDYDISPRHRMVCKSNMSVGNNGASTVYDIAFAKTSGRWMIISGEPLPPLSASSKDPPLLKGGDGQSDSCMDVFGFTNAMTCLDFTVIFQYELSIQPGFEQRKYLRIVTYKKGAGKYIWHQQPIDQKVSGCAVFVNSWHH